MEIFPPNPSGMLFYVVILSLSAKDKNVEITSGKHKKQKVITFTQILELQ